MVSMAEAVRMPISPDARLPAHGTLVERFYLRWPSLYAPLSRAVLSLPPRSRLRRPLLRRTMLSGWGAWARGDLDLTLPRYAPGLSSSLYTSSLPSEYVVRTRAGPVYASGRNG